MRSKKIAAITESLDNIADRIQAVGLVKEAKELDIISNTLEKTAKMLPHGPNRPAAIFPKEHPSVTDGKDHYPIPDKAHGRAALQRLSQFMDTKPTWWKGTITQFRSKILKDVKAKFPGMEIDEEKFKA